jgi:FkbM family methyltransferase
MNQLPPLGQFWSKRFWRKVAVKVLPENIKQPIRLRLHGLTGNRSANLLEFANDESGLWAVINSQIRLAITDAMKPSLNYQFLDSRDAIEEADGFIKLAARKSCLFDAGAHVGLFSLIFCGLGPNKTAIAYEPSSQILPTLYEHVKLNNFQNRITVRPVAIGSHDGEASFSVEDSGFVQILSSPLSSGKTTVPVKTIDSECQQLGLTPDLLKIDVEGFELEALRGAQRLLQSAKPDILLEVHLNYLEEMGLSSRDITEFLEGLGYHFFSCAGKHMKSNDIYDSLKPVVRFFALAQGKSST